MIGEWKVQISVIPGYMNKRIYMRRITGRTQEYLTHNGTVVAVSDPLAQDYNDLYFADMDDEQIQALADELARKGVKTTNDSKNEGLLEATTAHLEDMRTLVFKRSK